MPASDRGRALSVLAILFAVLAVSNLMKPLEMSADMGFVLLGQRLKGTPNLVAGPLFGVYLLVYAFGIWTRRRWALPMGVLYAVYVTLNLVLFPLRTPYEARADNSVLFLAVYAAVALGCSWGAVYLLARRRQMLS